ncbi:hypothetical protein IFM89_029622 [Coptis chinensis]|uniref:Succinate dehydrogenase assembly factor 4, mitochondrial n=1 Tax=Coptis chinensis TaxID=261450 RepID=A0A835IGY1_9MAGN|nr:hypothetical protein IFM89_029622 [Coptis chinensis]
MKNNLQRLFSSLIEIPKSKIGSGIPQSQPSIISNSRGIFTSFILQNQHQTPENFDNKKEEETDSETLKKEKPEQSLEEEEEGDIDEYGVNRKTGEVGGPKGPEPTRYGDWERGGRCTDF